MSRPNILFVDDEPALRLTLPKILAMHGFDVWAAGSVAEALTEITTHKFNVLISDLNIGEPGDGFTVVSAMRRTQPQCITFIITGYPAFESALSAIQRQVDGYFVKPAQVEALVAQIETKLKEGIRHGSAPLMRLGTLLRENVNATCEAALVRLKADKALCSVAADDTQRIAYFAEMLNEIADQLGSENPEECVSSRTMAGHKHGLHRAALGYRVSMLASDISCLDDAVHDLVRKHLLLLDTSHLVMDFRCLNDGLHAHLKMSLEAFWNASSRMKQAIHPRMRPRPRPRPPAG
jgi:ActR/RegA family two-component response regulator